MSQIHFPVKALSAFILAVFLAACSSSNAPQEPAKTHILSGDTSSVNFGAVIVDSVAHKYIAFTNTGNDTLHITSIAASNTTNAGLFSAKDSVGRTMPISVAPNGHLTIDAQFASLAMGDDDGAITITASDAGASIPTIHLHATGTARTVTTGSSYSYLSLFFDANNTQTGQSVTKQTVGLTDLGIADTNHVYEMVTDTTHNYYRRESNGDLLYYYPSSSEIAYISAGWVALPFGSKQKTIIKGDTQAVTSNNVSFNVQDTKTIEWIGTDSVTVAGKMLHVNVARLTVLFDMFDISGLGSAQITTVQTFYYSPYLGTFARRDFQLISTLPPQYVPSQSEKDVVTSYSIK